MIKFIKYIYFDSILSTPLHNVKRFCIYTVKKVQALYAEIESFPRHLGFVSSQYADLLKYKNKHSGKRCFITCTGPSLTIEDLELLKDEYVLGMNSICLIHDKTKWKPDFFGIQDRFVFEKVKEKLLATDNGVVFAPLYFKKKYKTPENWVYLPLTGAYHMYELIYQTRYFAKFSNNSYALMYDGYSITYTLLQLAVYMGFDEIYLLGADCTYMGRKQHFIEHGNDDPTVVSATERLFASYGEAKKFAEKNGIKIFNATRGGCLEMFPRVQLEDVVNDCQKNKISK